MKKRNEVIIFSVLVVAACLGSLLYVLGRGAEIRRMKTETADLYRQQPARQASEGLPANLAQLFPDKPEIAPFADSLALYAQKTGIRTLEVQTVEQQAARPARGGKAVKETRLKAHVMKVSLEGSYRSIAEYIRLVQNSERFCRVSELEIRPGKDLLKAEMTLEIYAIGEGNAS